MRLSRRTFVILILLPLLWPLSVVLHGVLSARGPLPQHLDGSSPVAPAPPPAPFYQHELIFQPVPEFVRFHAAALTECANGDLLAACRGDRPGSSRSTWDMSAAILVARKSKDATAWSPPSALSVSPGRMDTNPVLWTDPVFGGPAGTGGRIWLFHGTSFGVGWQYSRISFCFSDDNGLTWSPRLPINGVENLNTRCPPLSVPTSQGRNIVLPVYREYGMSSCLISSDNGVTWQSSERMISGIAGNYQPSLILRRDGSIAAFMRASGATCVLAGESLDGGLHWRPLERFDLTNPFTSVAAAQQSPGAPVYLAYNNTEHAERRNLTLALSLDEGRSFGWQRVITPAGAEERDAEYPAVLVTKDGLVHVAYTSERTAIAQDVCNAAWLQESGSLTPPVGSRGPGPQGLPALAAYLLLLLLTLPAAWLYRKLGVAAGPELITSSFRRTVLIGEIGLAVFLALLAPHGSGIGDGWILAADDFLAALRAFDTLLWLLLGLFAIDLLYTQQAPRWSMLGTLALLIGPLLFATVLAWVMLMPPEDMAFGAVERIDVWASSPRKAEEIAALRTEFQAAYRDWEKRTRMDNPGPHRPPETDPAAETRPELLSQFAARHNISVEQTESLSPYWTGERYIHPPELQRFQSNFHLALLALAFCWLLSAFCFWKQRDRSRPLPTADPAP